MKSDFLVYSLHIVWKELRDPEHMAEAGMSAMRVFLDDYEVGCREGRYVAAALPIADARCEIVLSSDRLLFYAEQLDHSFHRRSLAELRRVAREVRIFPVVDVNAQRSAHLEPLVAEVQRGAEPEIVRVPYECQRGGNEMLRFRGWRS